MVTHIAPSTDPPSHTRLRASGYAGCQQLSGGEALWRSCEHHQLVQVRSGACRVELDGAAWYLFVGRSAWVRAGARHRLVSDDGATLTTVSFTTSTFEGELPMCAVFRTPTLMREMMAYALRWRFVESGDERAERFFGTLADVCAEQVDAADDFRLARPASLPVARAIEWALSHLAQASVDAMATEAGVSPRTLTRRFRRETGMTAGRYVHTARMLRAMEMLAAPEARVGEVAAVVGFDSLSAFSHAFREFCGESPRDFRASYRAAA
jgi:AraC-like DNA-binding protein